MGKNISVLLMISQSVSLIIFHSRAMKKYILSLLFISSLVSAAPTPLEVTIADTLASYDIIVEQKTTTAYRLGDTITRAEAV